MLPFDSLEIRALHQYLLPLSLNLQIHLIDLLLFSLELLDLSPILYLPGIELLHELMVLRRDWLHLGHTPFLLLLIGAHVVVNDSLGCNLLLLLLLVDWLGFHHDLNIHVFEAVHVQFAGSEGLLGELSQVEWGRAQLDLLLSRFQEEDLETTRLVLELLRLLIILEDCPHLKLVVELGDLGVLLDHGSVSIDFSLTSGPINFKVLAEVLKI